MRVEDVLSDLDLLTIDRQVFTIFGTGAGGYATVTDKRRIAVSDWLAGELAARGFDPAKHTTSRAADLLAGVTGATTTDYTARLSDRTVNSPVDLSAVFVTPGTDVLTVGHVLPFKKLSLTLLDAANTSPVVASLTYWNGNRWQTLAAHSLVDSTRNTATSSLSFAGGGAFRFVPPDDWALRPASAVDGTWVYAVRLMVTARPSTSTLVYQITPTRQSRLTPAAGFYALHLLCLEASKGSRADWGERAELYAKKAYTALDRDLLLARDEFDLDNTGTATPSEVGSVTPSQHLYTWERG
jgi:hypothetical protein